MLVFQGNQIFKHLTNIKWKMWTNIKWKMWTMPYSSIEMTWKEILSMSVTGQFISLNKKCWWLQVNEIFKHFALTSQIPNLLVTTLVVAFLMEGIRRFLDVSVKPSLCALALYCCVACANIYLFRVLWDTRWLWWKFWHMRMDLDELISLSYTCTQFSTALLKWTFASDCLSTLLALLAPPFATLHLPLFLFETCIESKSDQCSLISACGMLQLEQFITATFFGTGWWKLHSKCSAGLTTLPKGLWVVSGTQSIMDGD